MSSEHANERAELRVQHDKQCSTEHYSTDSLRCELLHDQSQIHLTAVHLPALNTPQFEWCLSRLPKHPQPVPPIYQPEVAARGIFWAATHRRREVLVGFPTFKTVWGNKFPPGLADRMLASFGTVVQLGSLVLPTSFVGRHRHGPGSGWPGAAGSKAGDAAKCLRAAALARQPSRPLSRSLNEFLTRSARCS